MSTIDLLLSSYSDNSTIKYHPICCLLSETILSRLKFLRLLLITDLELFVHDNIFIVFVVGLSVLEITDLSL